MALDIQEKIREDMKSTNTLNEEFLISQQKRRLEIARKLLNDEDVTISDSKIKRGKVFVETKSSLDFVGKSNKREKKKQKNVERLNRIKVENPDTYKNMLTNIRVMDFIDLIINEKEIGYRLISKIYGNTLINQGKVTPEGILKGNNSYLNYAKELRTEDCIEEIERTLYEYAEYVDIDKLILTVITRKYLNTQTATRDIEEMNQMKEIADVLMSYIENERVSIYGIGEDFMYKEIEIKKDNPITLQSIKKSMKYYVNGINYGNGAVVHEIVQGLIDGTLNLDEFSDEEINILLINNKKERFMQADEKFSIRFIQMGVLSEKQIKKLKQGEMSEEIFINLYKAGKLTKDEILEKYLNNEIKLEHIRKLRDSLEDKQQLDDLVQPSVLTNAFLHRDYDNEKYQKFKNLFYELRIRNKTTEEANEVGNIVIEQDEDVLETQNLMQLYSDRLITIDNAVDWGGEDIAIKLFKSSKLSYKDARRLYEQEILQMSTFKEIIKDPSIKLVKKLSLINGTFSNPEDEDIRKDLVKRIKIEEKEKSAKKTRTIKSNPNLNPETDRKEYRKRVTDPAARWRLFRMIDPEYTEDVTKDGYLIKDMPNVNTVGIEPLYKSDDNITDYAVDAATFFVDRDVFMEKKDQIINYKNKVNVGFLNELYSNGEAFKITHTTRGKTWARKVERHFLDTVGIQRTPEELTAIAEAVKAVDKSCRAINLEV